MNKQQIALIEKDVKEILGKTAVWIPLIFVPFVMAAFMPILLFIGLQVDVNSINGLDMMMKNFTKEIAFDNDKQKMIYLAVNYMFPMLFLLIPVMASSILGANSFVNEKEHGTLETLFYTPITIREIFSAKVVGVFLMSCGVTLLSFLLFAVIVNIGAYPYMHEIIIPNTKWLILILMLSPSLGFLAISFIVLISAKVKTFQEAQQLTALIVFPIIFLMIGQTTGLFLLEEVYLFGAAFVIIIADVVLLKKATSRFTTEKLL